MIIAYILFWSSGAQQLHSRLEPVQRIGIFRILKFSSMCYHKSLAGGYTDLMAHYSASFDSITAELDIIKERFSILMSRDEKKEPYTNDEIKEGKWLKKIINSFTDTQYQRYHENGFDYLP